MRTQSLIDIHTSPISSLLQDFLVSFCSVEHIAVIDSTLMYVHHIAGHGFQKAPAFGKVLMELAMDLPPSYDIVHFRLDRFSKQRSKL